jgi:acyl dehydratase
MIRYDDVEVGTELPPLTVRLRRADLVRYAGASGDFNPIHWSDRVATSVGLPGVIAHGMLTMAHAGRLLTTWTGDPGSLTTYSVRFTSPVVVPDDDEGAELTLNGRVGEKLPDGSVRVDLTATSNGGKVLGAAKATVRLA